MKDRRAASRPRPSTARGRACGDPLPKPNDPQAVIRTCFADSIRAKEVFLQEHAADLARAADLVIAAFRAGKKVLLFGNGGSAADAQHIAAEFVGRFLLDRPALPAIALTTDTSALTALSNDFGYDEVFARQVRALGQAGDVAIAISTSGNSPSVLRAVDACRAIGIGVVGLTGGTGGALKSEVDVVLCVSAFKESPHIQETHILIAHTLCLLVDQAFATPAS